MKWSSIGFCIFLKIQMISSSYSNEQSLSTYFDYQKFLTSEYLHINMPYCKDCLTKYNRANKTEREMLRCDCKIPYPAHKFVYSPAHPSVYKPILNDGNSPPLNLTITRNTIVPIFISNKVVLGTLVYHFNILVTNTKIKFDNLKRKWINIQKLHLSKEFRIFASENVRLEYRKNKQKVYNWTLFTKRMYNRSLPQLLFYLDIIPIPKDINVLLIRSVNLLGEIMRYFYIVGKDFERIDINPRKCILKNNFKINTIKILNEEIHILVILQAIKLIITFCCDINENMNNHFIRTHDRILKDVQQNLRKSDSYIKYLQENNKFLERIIPQQNRCLILKYLY